MIVLKEIWPWHIFWIRFTFIAALVVSLILYGVGYLFMGNTALWFFSLTAWACFYASIYTYIARKVVKARDSIKQYDSDEIVDSLILLGKMKIPGAVTLVKDELRLAPIFGKKFTVPLAEIKSSRSNTTLAGKALVGKRAFHLVIANDYPLSFAIPESVAKVWQQPLNAYYDPDEKVH